MLQGRPLYDTPTDHRYFVAPPQWETIRRTLARGNNVLIHGERGLGKTTMLRQLELALREEDQPAAFVDAAAVAEPLELVNRVRDALTGRPGTLRSRGSVTATFVNDPSPPPAGASRQLQDTLIGLADDDVPATTILVDASASPHALYGVFGRMRDTVWQLPHHWVVTIDDGDYATALAPPADAFFDTTVALQRRSAHDLREILERRTDELPRETLARIAEDARGNPRTAIRAANETLVNGEDATASLGERARLVDRASGLGRPHAQLMAELLDLGQASPSDETLLDRLGLKRARVNTLLQQLHDAGLVNSAVERSDGPGRPRTIYRPTLHADR